MTEAAGVHSEISVTLPAPACADESLQSLSAWGYLLVASTAAAWTAAVGAVGVWRHNQFLSHRYDLGNMVQAVWSSAHGRLLEVTDGSTGEQVMRLAGHVDPVLLLLVPFWWIYPEPETLVVVQAAALAAGLYPVVRLALKHVGSRWAAGLLGLWYLMFPWVIWNALNDFHPVTLTIPLLLYAIWFLDEHRLGAFAVFGGLAMLAGELVGLTVAMLGVWYAIRYRRFRAGLSIALVGSAWTALCLAVLIPALNDGRSSRFYDRFESVGGSPSGLFVTLVTDPGAILSAISTSADLRYLMLILVPTAFLALGTPLLAAAAVPQLGINVLSDLWSTTRPMFQYVTPMIAPLVAATIIAVGRLPERIRVGAAAAPLTAGLICLLAVPPLPGEQDSVFGRTDSAARIAAMRRAIDRVPPGAAVTSTNRLGAHLSARRQIYLFPTRSKAEWAVLDTRDAWLGVGGDKVDKGLFQNLLEQFEDDPSWNLVFEDQGIRVYRKQS